MIKGLGTDIVEIERIIAIKDKYQFFYKRILTPEEQHNYLIKQKISFLAGRFSAKEACVKALGTGIGKISWQMIEVYNNEMGAPSIRLLNEANEYFIEQGGGKLHLSISHEKKYAIATVIWEQ